jgi:hypothetical protein
MSQILTSARPRASKNSNSPEISAEFLAKQHREPRRGDTSPCDPDPAAVAVEVDVGAPAGRPLGTYCENTGQTAFSAKSSREKRFKLQRIACEILLDTPVPASKSNPTGSRKGYRIHHCIYTISRLSDGVTIMMGTGSGKAKYRGLQSCGSVWVCTPCNHKITRMRETEIQRALELHFAQGGSCEMITYTHGHSKHDRLADLVEKYTAAKSFMTSHRDYRELMADFGFDGYIKALEATFGWAHGWHPHGHEVHFANPIYTCGPLPLIEYDAKLRRLRLKRRLFCIWLKTCKRFGLPSPSYKYGVDVSPALSAAEYISKFGTDQKWGPGKELTRLASKEADKTLDANERFTPFDLLRAYAKNYKRDVMKGLFREYSTAYYRKHQCQWSRGLKARFGIKDFTDEQLLALKEEEHSEVCGLSSLQWKKITRQVTDKREAVLCAAEVGGGVAVEAYVTALPEVLRPNKSMHPNEQSKTNAKSTASPPVFSKPKAKPGAVPGSYGPVPNNVRPELAAELAAEKQLLTHATNLVEHKEVLPLIVFFSYLAS